MGRVESIFLTDEHGELPQPVPSAKAVAGKGLEGNRYFFENGAPPGRALTLISTEALEAFEAEDGIAVSGAASRRNVLTRGVDVNALVGKHFSVGGVECYGVELCEPCAHLQSLTQPGVLSGLVHRAGLNADILTDGEVSVGDEIVVR